MILLALAESGFGKTASFVPSEKLGIKGLDPKDTYVISVTPKMLPLWKVTTPDKPQDGNRIITDDGPTIAKLISGLAKSPFKNIILDDANYIMQNFYMKNAMKNGWETPKQIGYFMGLIFTAMEEASAAGKNVIIFAHPETYKANTQGDLSYRMKTTGNMTQDYLTPEGKADIMLFGINRWNESSKKVDKVFVTDHDGTYPAKSQGIFDDMYIPNDMGMIVDKINVFLGV